MAGSDPVRQQSEPASSAASMETQTVVNVAGDDTVQK